MNHIYRLIWNSVSSTFVAVSEFAKAGGKKTSATRSKRSAASHASATVGRPRLAAGFTALEPRVMFDGAAFATVDAHVTDTSLHNVAAESYTSDTPPPAVNTSIADTRTEIVFIESNVADYQTLLNGVNPSAEVHILDASQDGLALMAQILSGRSGVDAIHIISHGSEGSVGLGTLNLSAQNLGDHAADLAIIGGALDANADILLYGCSVAAGSNGVALVDALAQATQADIAASTDATGLISQGGDWALETHTGEIDAVLAISDAALADYDRLLASPIIGVNNFDTLGATNAMGFAAGGASGVWVAAGSTGWDIKTTLVAGGTYNTGWLTTTLSYGGTGTSLTTNRIGTSDSLQEVSLRANDLSSFDLNSFQFRNASGATNTFNFVGYKNGSAVGGATYSLSVTNLAWTAIDVTSNSAFGNIDEFRISGPVSGWVNVYLDEINIAAPVVTGPTVNSATYNASTNVLTVTGSGMTTGDSIDETKLTLTGQGGATYTLTETGVITASSATSFSITLNATDQAGVETLLNKNGTTSLSGNTTYNLAAAVNWDVTQSAAADTTGNGVTVSSANPNAIFDYEAATGTITGFTDLVGSHTVTQVNTAAGETLQADSVNDNMAGAAVSGATPATGSETLYASANYYGESSVTFKLTDGKKFDLTSINLQEFMAQSELVTLASSKGSLTYSLAAGTVGSTELFNVSADANAAYMQGITSFTVTAFTTASPPAFDDPNAANLFGIGFDNITLANILSSNSAPTITDTPSDVTVTEDTASNFDLSAVTLADVDGDNLTVTLAASAGTFAASTSGSVTVGGSGTGTLTLSGSAANINTWLDTVSNIQYTGASNASGDNAATFTLKANDGTVDSSIANGNIDITAAYPLSSNPTLTFTANSSNITTDDIASDGEGGSVIISDLNLDIYAINSSLTKLTSLQMLNYNGLDILTFEDGPSTAYYGFAIKSSDGSNFSLQSLDFHDWGGYTGDNFVIEGLDGGVSKGTVNFAGNTTGVYVHLNQGGELGTSFLNVDEIRIYKLDGSNSWIGINNIQVGSPLANATPTVSSVPSDVTVTEDTASNFDLSAVTLADVDGDNLTVTLAASAGTFAASTSGSVTVGGSGTGTLTLSGSAANINTWLDTVSNIQYTGASNASGDNAATFTLKANDGTVDSSIANGNIDITAVNDAPINISLSSSSVAENTSTTGGLTIGALTTTDADSGDTFTYSIVGGTDQNDFQISGGNLQFKSGTVLNFETKSSYSVTVRITDAGNATYDKTFTVNLTDVNEGPTVANAIPDQSASATQAFSYTVPANTFADQDSGQSLIYSATKADGSALPTWIAFDAATRIFSGTPTSGDAGTLSIKVTATDNGTGSLSVFDTFDVVVSNGPTINSIVRAGGASATVATGDTSVDYTVTFSESVTSVDASDFALTTTGSAAGSITNITGSGDTYTVTVGNITGDGTLRLDLNGSGTGIQNGSLVDILSGYTSGQTYTLDHNNPSAPSTPDLASGSDSGSSSTDNITSDTTPTFTGTAEANSTVTLYDTDGTTVLGTTTADGSGNWSITSSTLSAGSHTITTKATDSAGNTGAASSGLSVTIDATVPSAPSTPDLASGSDTGSSSTDNITSDTTPTFTGTAEANSTVTLYDTDGTTVLGTTTADGSGNWSITSSTLSAGSHTITTKATDSAGNTSAASSGLSVTVDAVAPTAGTVTANNIYTNGSATHTFTVAYGDGSGTGIDSSSITTGNVTVTKAGGGTLTVSGVSYNAGVATYTVVAPGGSWDSVDADTYTIAINANSVKDVAGNAVAANATAESFVVSNNAPPTVANAIADQNASEDSAFSYQFAANTFADVDVGDTLTYTASTLPAWLSFDAATRTFSGTPANGDVGSFNVTVTATDGSNTTATDTFAITVGNVNDAPTLANAIADQNATEDSAFSYQFAANTFNDVDAGDSLTYTTSTLPVWLSFNATTRNFSGTPANGDVGSFNVTVTATDGSNATVTDAFAITVANTNDAPTSSVSSLTISPVSAGSAMTYTLPNGVFIDEDVGDNLTYNATLANGDPLPSWITFNAATQRFDLNPPLNAYGQYALNVTATDASGATVTVLVNAEVKAFVPPPPPPPPVTEVAPPPPAPVPQPPSSEPVVVTPQAPVVNDIVMPEHGVGSTGVVVLGSDAAVPGVAPSLVVSNPLQDQATLSGSRFEMALPIGTFQHSDANAFVTLEAQQSNGSPLPGWLRFDSATGKFTGQPPAGFSGVLQISVIARDSQGREAVTTFKIKVGREVNSNEQRQNDRPNGERRDGQQRNGALPDSARQVWLDSIEGKNKLIKVSGRTSLSEQLSQYGRFAADAKRQVLLDRIAKHAHSHPVV